MSKLGNATSIPDFYLRLSQLPCQQSIKSLEMHHGHGRGRYESRHLCALASFLNLQHLALWQFKAEESDLIFLISHLPGLDTLEINLSGTETAAYYRHVLQINQMRKLASFYLCTHYQRGCGRISFRLSRHAENTSVTHYAVYRKGYSSFFHNQLYSMLGSKRFCCVHELHLAVEEMTAEALQAIQTGYPLLQTFNLFMNKPMITNWQNYKPLVPFLLSSFPQGWRRLTFVEIIGEIEFSLDGIMSIASSSRFMRKIVIQVNYNYAEERRGGDWPDYDAWKNIIEDEYPKIIFRTSRESY